jgi:class 3 adenylate cyclase
MAGLTRAYLVTDIIGSSLQMQDNERQFIYQQENIRKLLVSVVRRSGGQLVDFSGDSVTACFDCCEAAVSAGFSMHDVLQAWKRVDGMQPMKVRIGIHAENIVAKESETPESILSQAYRLESMGRADALCVSGNVLACLDSRQVADCHRLKARIVTDTCEHTMIYYLFRKPPRLLVRQWIYLQQLMRAYDRFASSRLSQFAAIVLGLFTLALLVAVMWPKERQSLSSKIASVELKAFTEIPAGVSRREVLHNVVEQVELRLAKKAENTGRNDREQLPSRTKGLDLVFAYQDLAGTVRISWLAYNDDHTIHYSGGYVTGNAGKLPVLRRRLVNDIVGRLAPMIRQITR